MIKKTFIFILISSLLLQGAFALRSPEGISPRALGMGQAFTAIADDAFAAYWNPAGFAINPGIDLTANYQANNRNQAIGDNAVALKGCFEIGIDPFTWMLGVGMASAMAYEGAQYLADREIVKKNWGRSGEKKEKGESMAESVKKEGEEKTTNLSKKKVAKQAAKELAKGTIFVAKKYAKAALKEAARQTRHYYYSPPWYRPYYYRPSYWDNRYDYKEAELTPAGKAQFGGGITVMSDQNSSLDQDTNWYSFSFASGYGEIAAIGSNINIYDLKIPSTNIKGLGAGLDIGALLRISDALMFGLTAKELLTTDIQWENGSKTRYMMTVNGGMAIKPISQITVAGDMHNIFGQNGQDSTNHYGVEVRPVYGLAVRGGLSDGNKTAGISIAIEQLIIDYAILGGAYGRTQLIGATWKI